MDITIQPRSLQGQIQIIPSKSQAHRLLICAAFAEDETTLLCPQTSKDIAATAACLEALGAKITRTAWGYHIVPVVTLPESAVLACCESGSTLRFLLPVAGALGVDTVFRMEGRLSQRPLSPLWEEMQRMGCRLTWLDSNRLHCCGKLRSGKYRIDGGVSSQFISGLLFAAALMQGQSCIEILGELESKQYVTMTQEAMAIFGVDSANFCVQGGKAFCSPGEIAVEGDWSNGAFFLAAAALGSDVQVLGLSDTSTQPDRTVQGLLPQLCKENMEICAVG